MRYFFGLVESDKHSTSVIIILNLTKIILAVIGEVLSFLEFQTIYNRPEKLCCLLHGSF